MSSVKARRLIWVPIIHTSADLGSLQSAVRRIHEQRGGTSVWQERVRQIGQLWRSIRTSLMQLELDWSSVLLYQDGLPVCGKEVCIVQDLARAGSANHRLLVELMAKGAQLVGTESPELLIEEYELNRQLLLNRSTGVQRREGGERAEKHDLSGAVALGSRHGSSGVTGGQWYVGECGFVRSAPEPAEAIGLAQTIYRMSRFVRLTGTA